MVILSGADFVRVDRIDRGGTLVIDDGRIVDLLARRLAPDPGASVVDASGCLVVPGFIDVHVHGLLGHDTLDGPDAIETLSQLLPRFGVTAFCPTTVACAPDRLEAVLHQVAESRGAARPGRARVLPAHLESNFLAPEFAGAQPVACLRRPPASLPCAGRSAWTPGGPHDFTAEDVVSVLERHSGSIGVVTLASELHRGLDLVRFLVERGVRVSLGHSGATYEEALEAVEAGATRATHLFNRMPPLGHRAPGLAGAVLGTHRVAAEVIADGVHLHPAAVRLALAAKGPARLMAVSDGTAGAGLPVGASARLGGQPITVRDEAAFLDTGVLAGSTATMERVFRTLTSRMGISLIDAARLCATSPARELGLADLGELRTGAAADLVVLDPDLRVRQTWIGGQLAFQAPA